MEDWLEDYKIPVGKGAKVVFDWIRDHGEVLLDGFAAVMEAMIDAILWVMQEPPAIIVIAAFVAATWFLQKSWKTCLFVFLGFLFILNQGYWEETTESLTLVLSACLVCMAIGVPIGIAAAHRPKLYTYLRPVLDLMQTLPTFVYLIPRLSFSASAWCPASSPRLSSCCPRRSG